MRRHVRRGNAVRVWLRRPWFSSGDGEQLAVVLEPGSRLRHGWEYVDTTFQSSAVQFATQQPAISRVPLRRASEPSASVARAQGGGTFQSAAASGIGSQLVEVGLSVFGPPPPTAEQIRTMLVPYVTQWGSDPVWESALPLHPPTVADFPRHVGFGSNLTLAETSSAARVVVAAHEVSWSPERKLWYCDIEIDAGNAYFPFVRLALARYQPHSVDGAHLSRVIMTDFIQLAPDRTAELKLSGNSVGITVNGFAGRNALANISRVPSLSPIADVIGAGDDNARGRVGAGILAGRASRADGTRAEHDDARGAATARSRRAGRSRLANDDRDRAVAQREQLSRRVDRIAGLPANAAAGSHRILVTESETYLRTDIVQGDPNVSTSPLDFVRERVVYADAFDL